MVESVRHCDVVIAVDVSSVAYGATSLMEMAEAAGRAWRRSTQLSAQAVLAGRNTATEGAPALVALVAAC